MTLTEKILSQHIVEGTPAAGERVGIRIDQTLTQDATGTMAYLELEAMGIDHVKTDLSVSYVDHNMSQQGPRNMNDHIYLQTCAGHFGIYFSRPGNGICHQVHLERFGVPGKTLLGSDSHTPTNGGVGMIAIGAGGLNVALAMAGKPFHLTWPRVIGVRLTGSLPPWVSAKDVILKLLSLLSTKGNVGCIVEYFGPGVSTLSVPERATITNMGAELGVTTSIFPSDDVTRAFLKAQNREDDWQELSADNENEYDKVIEIDLSELVPHVTKSPSPDNVMLLSDVAGMPVQQVIIGSCTNSSYRDLKRVAEIVKGKTVNPNTALLIAPGSRQVLKMLSDDGALATLIAAGARILESACGPCIGQGASPGDGMVSVRTFNRNFAGRSGTKDDTVFLTSPETAAITALKGAFTMPEDAGIEYPEVEEPAAFEIDDSMILPPPADPVEIVRGPTIGDPPCNTPMPETIKGRVVIQVGDKITTDHIMPAGPYLKFRSHIGEYSKVVFSCFNEEGSETFAEHASKVRDAGEHGIIVGGESYGQGSSREHAAICPMYLGVKCVIARSFERIHKDNLVNFGILPLTFADEKDYELLSKGEQLTIENAPTHVREGNTITATCEDGTAITLKCELTPAEKETVIAGGILNQM